MCRQGAVGGGGNDATGPLTNGLPIPEPARLGLCLLGATSLALRRRR
ncbi:MAG: PEP-CTERM sorting domain-containing protein [Phycisphaerae bacterium]|nr:PEP-CTERM sorting domain-containing protein [Phycisphaerae bacterium]